MRKVEGGRNTSPLVVQYERTWTESEHQQRVMRWAEEHEARWSELWLLHHVPNGGWRHKATAKRLVLEGVKPGVPDLCLPAPRGGFHGLYVEMKAYGQYAKPRQRLWHAKLRAQGYRVEVCQGWRSAAQVLQEYLTS